jgi:hypothetical protein
LIALIHIYMTAHFPGLIALIHIYMTAHFPGLIALIHISTEVSGRVYVY